MNYLLSILILILLSFSGYCQNLYFPPVNGDVWDELPAHVLGYCPDKVSELYDMLDQENSKAFLLLKDGKIVLEKYFGSFTKDSVWYWASAGKSLTAFLTGLAYQEGKIVLDAPSSTYLGKGWTSVPPDKEDLITVRHQLSMTSGLDDTMGDRDCTDPVCLRYLADAGTRWAYHNAPYTLLDKVIENATGQGINLFSFQMLRQSTGITGSYVKLGFNNVYFSRPRSMARFGLLMLNKGKWANTTIMSDSTFFHQMINSSQTINPSYGYLWWLNGKPTFMVPQLQFNFPGKLFPSAPDDCYAALGRDGQMLHIVPSQNLIWVRMGNSPESVSVPYLLADKIWKKINDLVCTSSLDNHHYRDVKIVPNPANFELRIEGLDNETNIRLFNTEGRLIFVKRINDNTLDIEFLQPGMYIIQLQGSNKVANLKWIKL